MGLIQIAYDADDGPARDLDRERPCNLQAQVKPMTKPGGKRQGLSLIKGPFDALETNAQDPRKDQAREDDSDKSDRLRNEISY